MSDRPRICWFCPAVAVEAVQQWQRTVAISRRGDRRDGGHWESRFVCATHRALDPWVAP